MAATAVAAWLRYAWVPRYFRIYTDEHFYILASRHVLALTEGYEKSYGWPAMLAVVFGTFGRSASLALLTSATLGVLTVPLIWLIGRRGAPSTPGAGVLAACAVAVWPVHVLWSATAETNVPCAFAALLGLTCWQNWNDDHSWAAAWLCTCALAAAASTRPEAFVLCGVLAASAYVRGVHTSGGTRAAAPPCLAALWASPNMALALSIQWSTNWPRAEQYGTANAVRAFFHLALSGELQTWWVVLLATVGALTTARDWAWTLLAWSGVTIAVLLGAGAGALAGPERLLILPLLPMILMAGAGGAWVVQRAGRWWVPAAASLVGLLGLCSWPSLRAAHSEITGYRIQATLADDIAPLLPAGCLLVANLPEIYEATLETPVMSVEDYLSHPHTGCVRFVWDLTCFEWGQFGTCNAAKDLSHGPPLLVRTWSDRTAALYDLSSLRR